MRIKIISNWGYCLDITPNSPNQNKKNVQRLEGRISKQILNVEVGGHPQERRWVGKIMSNLNVGRYSTRTDSSASWYWYPGLVPGSHLLTRTCIIAVFGSHLSLPLQVVVMHTTCPISCTTEFQYGTSNWGCH